MRLTTLLLAVAALLSANESNFERALSLYEHTDYSHAIAALKQSNAEVLQRDPASLELLGRCYFMQGDFSDATDSLGKAAALKPGDSIIQTWLARAWGSRAENSFPLAAAGYALKSRQAFEKAIQLDPGNAEALNDLFEFYMQAPGIMGGGMEKARKLLPQIERVDPTGAQLALARIDEDRREFDKAEGHLRQAIALAPHQPGLLLDLAQFLARRGRPAESEKVFEQAVALSAPNAPRILFTRAQTWIGAGRNVKEARSLLQQYLASNNLTPKDPPRWEAARLLKKTEGQ